MDYTYIGRHIDNPSYFVNIVEDKNGVRLFELFTKGDNGIFYSTDIDKINEEIEEYLAFMYSVNGVD